MSFTFEPLEEPLDILGFPEVELTLESDRPEALVAVRLCAVAPDGSSLLITRGLLNLTHREGHDKVEPLERGRPYDVSVRLDAIGHSVPATRSACLSSSYWPWAWPSPEPVTLTLQDGRLLLPVRPSRGARTAAVRAPEWGEPLAVETIEPGRTSREHSHDNGTHEIAFEWDVGGRRRLAEARTEMDDTSLTTYRITDGDPLSASVEARCSSTLARDSGARVDTHSAMSATASEFLVTQRLDAFEGDEQVYSRTWELVFPRDGV